jgi:hypothetical protein
MEMPVVEKLLSASGKPRPIMSAYKPGEGALPVNRQTFEPFEKLPVE